MGQENREMFSIIGVKNDSLDLLFNLANKKPAKQTLEAICSGYEKLIQRCFLLNWLRIVLLYLLRLFQDRYGTGFHLI